MPTDYQTRVHEKTRQALGVISKMSDLKPQVGVVLGSGLGAFADHLKWAMVTPYSDIPHMPVSSVEGHAGNLILGDV